MEKSEAVKQIEEISKIVNASNRVIFSGPKMIGIGIMVLFIPLIEIPSQGLTFGFDFGPMASYLIPLIHIAFYWILSMMIGKGISRWLNEKDTNEIHPLVKQAFSLHKPILTALFGTILVLIPIGQGALVFPMVYLFLGVLFSLYGKFSIPKVSYIAWTYIGLGLIYAYLTNFHINNLWIVFTSYLGLSYIIMGYFLCQERKVS